MYQLIHGRHYYATTNGGQHWFIKRGRFLMSEFLGDTEALLKELESWDDTVKPTGATTHEQ